MKSAQHCGHCMCSIVGVWFCHNCMNDMDRRMIGRLLDVEFWASCGVCSEFEFDGFSIDMTRSMVAMCDVSLSLLPHIFCLCVINSAVWCTVHAMVLWHCWLGHMIRKTVSEMTYNVSSGTLNSTILPFYCHSEVNFAYLASMIGLTG